MFNFNFKQNQNKESKMSKKEEINKSISTLSKTNNDINIKDLQKNEKTPRIMQKENDSNAKQVIDLQYKEYDTPTQAKTEKISDKESIKHGKSFDLNSQISLAHQ